MHTRNRIITGTPIEKASAALIMVHGRGGSAEDILSVADHLAVKNYALLAPQASGNSWYPYSFLAPPAQNEPGLSSALAVVKELVAELETAGIPKEKMVFLGFSQGACLTLEFVTRHAARYGGVVAFTGGLIGDKLYPENYSGDFGGTPVFIGSSDPDPHVPVQRVKESTAVLEKMKAVVTEKIYTGMGHTINADELRLANEKIFSTLNQ